MTDSVLLLLKIIVIVFIAFSLTLFVIYTYRDAKEYIKKGKVKYTTPELRIRLTIWISLPLLFLLGIPLLLSSDLSTEYIDTLIQVVTVIGIVMLRSLPGLLLLYFFIKNRKK